MKQELVMTLSPSDVRLAVEQYVRREALLNTGEISVSLLTDGGAVARADTWPPSIDTLDLDVVAGLPADEELPF